MRALACGCCLLVSLSAAEVGAAEVSSSGHCGALSLGDGTVSTSKPLIAGDPSAQPCLEEIARTLHALPRVRSVTVAARLPDAVRAKKNVALSTAEEAAAIFVKAGFAKEQVSIVAPPPRAHDPSTLTITWTQAPRGRPVARVLEISGEVRAGPEGATPVVLSREAELFLWDEIRTGPGAGADLMLQDGTTLRMDPDSVLRLQQTKQNGTQPQRLVLSLVSGAVDLRISEKPGEVEFRAADTLATARAARFRMNRSTSDVVRVESLEGSVKLKASGREVVLEAGTGAHLQGKATAPPRKLLEAPVARAPLFGPVGRRTTLTWETVRGARAYRVEVSRTPDFLVDRKVLRPSQSRVSPELSEGRWYWRVYGEDADAFIGAPSKIHAIDVVTSPTGE